MARKVALVSALCISVLAGYLSAEVNYNNLGVSISTANSVQRAVVTGDVMRFRPFDSDGDGTPDGNPSSPESGTVWLNGTSGCGRLMAAESGVFDCVTTAPCPAECF